MSQSFANSPDARFSVREDLVVEEVDDEYLVLDLRGNEYFGLNEVARLIWEAIDEGASFGGVVNRICVRFDVGREQAAEDAAAFIEQTIDAGLVERVES
ncbi:MAG: PqqD family protein [Persicimonas sp.]